jgi:superfamily II DNA or RNA helicase
MRLSHALIESGTVARLIVVVPKEHLKGQFARSMAGAGISLDSAFENSAGRLPSDLNGAVVTYQQVAFAPKVFRQMCREVPTMVILDEVHHAGDEATWGKALREAFDLAKHRVSMSGTPFRSDGTPIPFVDYDRGMCTPDYAYDYAKALKDGVCRPLVFSMHGVVAEWVSRDGLAIEASFETALENRRQESERLRTALTQDGWMGEVLASAQERLIAIRQAGHTDAGGLVVAMNQDHARYIAKLLRDISGIEPTIVMSAEDEASRRLQRFTRSSDPWIVAVHMVSEGVDIPRLRVGVYATNVGTPMYFRQFCGRFVRTQGGIPGEQHAFVYMPDDPYLRPLAQAIHIEVQGQLKGKDRRELPFGAGAPGEEKITDSATDDFYSPIAAHATENGLLHGGAIFAAMDAREASTSPFARDMVADGSPEAAAIAATRVPTSKRRRSTPEGVAALLEAADAAQDDPLAERRALRREINALVARVKNQFSVDHRKIHGSLNSRVGGSLAVATKVELEKRRTELLRWLARNVYDGYR